MYRVLVFGSLQRAATLGHGGFRWRSLTFALWVAVLAQRSVLVSRGCPAATAQADGRLGTVIRQDFDWQCWIEHSPKSLGTPNIRKRS